MKGRACSDNLKKIKDDLVRVYRPILQMRDDMNKHGGWDIALNSGEQVEFLNFILGLMWRMYNNILEMENKND